MSLSHCIGHTALNEALKLTTKSNFLGDDREHTPLFRAARRLLNYVTSRHPGLLRRFCQNVGVSFSIGALSPSAGNIEPRSPRLKRVLNIFK